MTHLEADETDEADQTDEADEASGPPPRTHAEEVANYLSSLGQTPDLIIDGGSVDVVGTFAGTIQVDSGTLVVDGTIVGNVINQGGEVIIRGKVTGQVVGEHTLVERPAVVDTAPADDDGTDTASSAVVARAGDGAIIPVPERKPVIEVRGVGKKFAISLQGTMRHGISDAYSAMRGRQARVANREDEFWALRDVSFDLYEGGAIGMMGLNGSGKTTLMRILAGLYQPDEGSVTVHGTAIGIFGVGSGFHPHLSGRENVYVNAALLGLSRAEIDERLDEILDFAELGNFIDSATGLYSSGMKMRLGFSIMTTLRPQALLLDEVFAVGDIAFREKCLDRLKTIRDTTTIFIVAQHPVILDGICDELLWVHQGGIKEYGDFNEVMDIYMRFAGRAQLEGSLGSARQNIPGK